MGVAGHVTLRGTVSAPKMVPILSTYVYVKMKGDGRQNKKIDKSPKWSEEPCFK